MGKGAAEEAGRRQGVHDVPQRPEAHDQKSVHFGRLLQVSRGARGSARGGRGTMPGSVAEITPPCDCYHRRAFLPFGSLWIADVSPRPTRSSGSACHRCPVGSRYGAVCELRAGDVQRELPGRLPHDEGRRLTRPVGGRAAGFLLPVEIGSHSSCRSGAGPEFHRYFAAEAGHGWTAVTGSTHGFHNCTIVATCPRSALPSLTLHVSDLSLSLLSF